MKRLLEPINLVSEVSFSSVLGSCPVRLLPRIDRRRKDAISPIAEGSDLVREFPLSARCISPVSNPMDDGMDPLRALKLASKRVSDCSSPMDDGIDPAMENSKAVSVVSSVTDSRAGVRLMSVTFPPALHWTLYICWLQKYRRKSQTTNLGQSQTGTAGTLQEEHDHPSTVLASVAHERAHIALSCWFA